MAMQVEDTQFSGLAEVLFEKGLDGLGSAVEILINEAMRIERARYLNAEPYERTEARSDYQLVAGFILYIYFRKIMKDSAFCF